MFAHGGDHVVAVAQQTEDRLVQRVGSARREHDRRRVARAEEGRDASPRLIDEFPRLIRRRGDAARVSGPDAALPVVHRLVDRCGLRPTGGGVVEIDALY